MVSAKERANRLYKEGRDAFRAGDNQRCIELTRESLEIGRALQDDPIIAQALMGLCRVALRTRDEDRLRDLSQELGELARRTGDDWWLVVVAHMNAEMARMNGELDRASNLYDESMRISEALGNDGMVSTECFNKSFVAIAQGDFESARDLLGRHLATEARLNDGDIEAAEFLPYSLIALAALLVAEDELEEAALAAFACRGLMAKKRLVPDPADEEPLLAVEQDISQRLSSESRTRLRERADGATASEILSEHIVWEGQSETRDRPL